MSLLAHSVEFEYLNNVPVLTMDVSEDFKGSKIRSADMIEKVSDSQAYLPISKYSFIGCIKAWTTQEIPSRPDG